MDFLPKKPANIVKAKIFAIAIVAVAAMILLTLQVRSEEKRLAQDFGQEYLDYKKRVGRYF